ncbi:uncharacterized protein LOC133520731 [Cydia pomonella]|uniref:uncharacterized protein LOC133520731 n=1 Tax=Cydia pomonella TaxID=82600 RepID=UPI002ADE8E6B|nr:uncharacterized protein LOC133520731 [Cydia pomonella]
MNNYIQVIVLLVLVSVAIECITPTNKFEDGLLRLIEKCRNDDVQSLPFEFPSLKRLRIPPMMFNYHGYRMSVSETKVKGLEDLSVQKLSASPVNMTMAMEIFVPTLAIRADRYHLQGTIMYIFSIDDKGVFKSNVNRLRARANIKFGAKENDTVVTHLKLDYSVNDIKIQLGGSSDTVNGIANNMISDLINSSETKNRLQLLIKQQANRYLRGHTPQEFVEIVSRI